MKIDQKGIIGILGILVVVVAMSGCTSSSDSDSGLPYMSEEDIRANATTVSGEEFQRNAVNLTGQPVKITGKVFDLHNSYFLMYMDDNIDYTVYVSVNGVMPSNIIDDDVVTVYGQCGGKYDYETAAGGSNNVPYVEAWPDNIVLS